MPGTARYALISFFLLNTANFLLRPVRDGIGIHLGTTLLPYLFLATLLCMLLLAVPFGRFSGQSIRLWIGRYYGIFIGWLLLALGLGVSTDPSPLLSSLFFISVSVFNLFSISLLWSNLVSRFSYQDAGQLFGKITTGLALGAIVGSVAGSLLIDRLGQGGMIGLAIVAICSSYFLQHSLLPKGDPQHTGTKRNSVGLSWQGISDQIGVIRQSPLLRTSSMQIFFYAMINTFFYFEQLELVQSTETQPLEQVQKLANIALIIHASSLILQWFGFQHFLRWFSKKQLLVIVPAIISILMIAQLLHPAFWLLIAGMTGHKIGNYALIRPLREVLHTDLEPEAKYGAKNLVDTVFSRSGDVAGSWIYEPLINGLFHPLLPAVVCLPVSLAWIWNSWRLAAITQTKEHL